VRVVIVADEVGFPRGFAATNYVRLFAKGLVHAGASAHVICLDFSERSTPPLNTAARGELDGVTFEYTTGSPILPSFPPAIPMGRALSHARFLSSVLREPPDAIFYYGRWPSELLIAMAAARLTKAALVCIVVEWRLAFPDQTRTQVINDELFCRAMRRIDGAIVVSAFLRDRVTPRLADGAPCLQTPIFADPEPWANVVPASRGKRYLVFCADLTGYREDALLVIRALVGLGPRELEVLFVGSASPEARERILESSNRLPRGMSLKLMTDYLPEGELRCLYAGASALVAPLPDNDRSRARFPSKIGDYLLSGTPVVSHRVGEVAAFLKDGESAYLAAPNDEADFARCLARALDAPDARDVGARGRAVALAQFDYKTIGPRVVDFLRPLVARRA